MGRIITPIRLNRDMEITYAGLAEQILNAEPFDRGGTHAQATANPDQVTKEVLHTTLEFEVPEHWSAWVEIVKPNMPWAEDHFKERVSGEPLNPPPSNEWWPYAQAGNAVHKKDEKFSHTYPERFWPKMAGSFLADDGTNWGIRFGYGDLEDLVTILQKTPLTRQAYLPVWFPEDLSAARDGERVPCTLGYHFIQNQRGELDVTYHMRSCDLVRFLRDDAYMAGRLAQWVASRVEMAPGRLRMHIANLHAFVGDNYHLRDVVARFAQGADPRSSYNLDALG